MYNDSSKFYVFDEDNDIIQVIDGYRNLIRITFHHIKAGTIGNSFKTLIDYYDPYNTQFTRVKDKIDYVITDDEFRVVTVQRILQDCAALNVDAGPVYGRRRPEKGDWAFRKDPIPGTGNTWRSRYYRHPKTTQERRWNCGHKKYTRGARRCFLPNAWDDYGRSDAMIKHSWKKQKKRKQWM